MYHLSVILCLHGNPGRLEEIRRENILREQNTDAHAEYKKFLLSNLLEQCKDSRESHICTQVFQCNLKKNRFFFYCSWQSDWAATNNVVQHWPCNQDLIKTRILSEIQYMHWCNCVLFSQLATFQTQNPNKNKKGKCFKSHHASLKNFLSRVYSFTDKRLCLRT